MANDESNGIGAPTHSTFAIFERTSRVKTACSRGSVTGENCCCFEDLLAVSVVPFPERGLAAGTITVASNDGARTLATLK